MKPDGLLNFWNNLTWSKTISTHQPELLLPAGNPDKLRTALLYGADAIYLGGKKFNLRAASEGFDDIALAQAVRQAEAQEAKIYYCLNSLPTQDDLASLPDEIEKAAQAGVHAFIIADPGVLRLAQKYAPKLPMHLSTQANTTNAEAVAFWLDQGVERVNLARELSRDEISSIRAALPHANLEVFVQGAMCLAVSGQCLLSAWLNKRPANAGRCTQPCRFEYRAESTALLKDQPFDTLMVEEALRPGETLWQVQQDEKYSSFWAPEDLCLLPYLLWFSQNNITTIKVEGRTKSAAYVAHMADAYKSALSALAGSENFEPEQFMRELMYISSRPLGTGFFMPGQREIWPRPQNLGGHEVVARVLEQNAADEWLIEVRANWPENADIELMLPGLKRPRLTNYELINHRGEQAKSLPNGIKATLLCTEAGLRPGIFLRFA